jgi:hypothetical protein
MFVVEGVVVDVVTKYECTYWELIGKIGCCPPFEVWELML